MGDVVELRGGGDQPTKSPEPPVVLEAAWLSHVHFEHGREQACKLVVSRTARLLLWDDGTWESVPLEQGED